MASGDLISKVADKDTLDRTYANTNAILAAVGTDVQPQGIKRYGVKINKNDSNPSTRVEYLFDAVGMTPASMNYSAGTFDYGSWGDVFFVKNNYPAMVKYDGTEDYKLSTTDHAYKEDGTTASDVSNMNYGGNAMSVFDGTVDGKIWLSQFEIGNYEYMIISNVQYDESYNDDAYIRKDGTHADKLYYPMFKGSFDGTRIRSIAGQTDKCNTTASQEIGYCEANGTHWGMWDWAHQNLLHAMCVIMSKSDDCQTAFGRGQDSGYSSSATNYGKLSTGTLTDKGQFYGYNDGTHDVKVFYMESRWGLRWDRMLGQILNEGKLLVKMFPPYNLTGDGYTDVGITPSGTSGGYISKTLVNKYGRLPKVASGSSSTYLCDGLYFNNSGVRVALVGGDCLAGLLCGSLYVHWYHTASDTYWDFGASIILEQPVVA
jgi:hypothetical protein